MAISGRIKEERERMGLTQAAFGQIGGVGKTTVSSWESGATFPNAEFLEVASQAGADVLYIVTGRREKATAPPALTSQSQLQTQSEPQSQTQPGDPYVPLNEPVNPDMMERVFDMVERAAKRRGKILPEREKLHMAADLYNHVYKTIFRDSGSK
jgi:transcriptional regulator with XRE-family HTH domain